MISIWVLVGVVILMFLLGIIAVGWAMVNFFKLGVATFIAYVSDYPDFSINDLYVTKMTKKVNNSKVEMYLRRIHL